jgi:probable HAF family extracellular repeat protein
MHARTPAAVAVSGRSSMAGKVREAAVGREHVHAVRRAGSVACALAGLLVALTAAAAVRPAGYLIVDLGGLPAGSGAFAINTEGFAAGYQMVGPNLPHAVLFSGGLAQDLGTLGGDASLANAVGADGQVVGWARRSDATRHAFLYRGGVMEDLGTLGGSYSMAFAVNRNGVVVGASAVDDARKEVPFVWNAAAGMQPLPLPGGLGGSVHDINDAGEMVGYVMDTLGSLRAFRSDGRTVELLAELEFAGSKAYGINGNGVAVGYAMAGEGAPHFHAVLWRGGTVEDLGAMAGGHSVAYGVNDAGTAVGFSYTQASVMVATVFEGSAIVDLNDVVSPGANWQLAMATAITHDGVISGIGTLDGASRAFALVPAGLRGGAWGTPALVTSLALRAWPLPMRDAGTLELDLPRAVRGRVVLYDVSGRRVAELASGDFAAGRVRVPVGADALASAGSGVFYLRFEGEKTAASVRVVIVR